MKSGFVVIELLIVTIIAGMISAAAYMGFGQISLSFRIIDDMADIDTKSAIARQQFERDLLGAFIPFAAIPEEEPEAPQQQPGQLPAPVPQLPKKEKRKPITKVFYGINKEKVFDTLSFITSDPVQVYWSSKVGKLKPRIARVTYRLVKDKEFKNSYNLTRQEGIDLKFESYKPGGTKEAREFELIDGIKNMTIEYGVIKKEKKEKEEKKEKKGGYKIVKEWKVELEQKKEGKKEEKKEEVQLIPDVVIFKFSLWDAERKRDTAFEFKIPIVEQKPPENVSEEAQPQPQNPQAAQVAIKQRRQEILANLPDMLKQFLPPNVFGGNQALAANPQGQTNRPDLPMAHNNQTANQYQSHMPSMHTLNTPHITQNPADIKGNGSR